MGNKSSERRISLPVEYKNLLEWLFYLLVQVIDLPSIFALLEI